MEPSLSQVIHWARQSGAILREGVGKRHTIGYKTDSDLVTEIDQRTEAFLIEQIQTHFPDHSIVGEENGTFEGHAGACWYIDPVDGTTNYAHGLPYFCVSIAFADELGSRLGVVYDPMLDEVFSAERGKGAWLNGRLIHVSEVQELRRSLVVTGFSHNEPEVTRVNNVISTLVNDRVQSLRRMGSSALNQAYVAAGRMDAYWELLVKPWDIGAGILLVQEAGGIVTRLHGSRERLLEPPCDLLAATPAIYEELLNLLSQPVQ